MKKRKLTRRGAPLLITSVITLAAIIIGASIYVYQLILPLTDEEVFLRTIAQQLSTTSFKMEAKEEVQVGKGATFTTTSSGAIDTSNITRPAFSGHVAGENLKTKTDYDTVVIGQDVYIRYNKFIFSHLGMVELGDAHRQWVQTRDDGKNVVTPNKPDSGYGDDISYLAGVAGFLPTGNFTEKQRQELLTFIKKRQPYKGIRKAKHDKSNGTSVYTLSLRFPAIVDFIKKTEGMTGEDVADWIEKNRRLYDNYTIKITVDNKNQRILTYVTHFGEDPGTTVTLSDYNKKVSIVPPTPRLSTYEFQQALLRAAPR